MSQQISAADASDYLRSQLNIPPHAAVNLWSVPDPAPGEKPTVPLPLLIKLAIYGSGRVKLTPQEVYSELCSRFKWFRQHQQGPEAAWKSSVRHQLKLSREALGLKDASAGRLPGRAACWDLNAYTAEEKTERRRGSLREKPQKTLARGGDTSSYPESDHSGSEYSTDSSISADDLPESGFPGWTQGPSSLNYLEPQP
ncbi:hypothetical protein DFH09DRAFT_1318985 [Mycena vulgaris]|nr:hypothetical protein DFH09DRAFT_1318985 [Mycena vulgaris]